MATAVTITLTQNALPPVLQTTEHIAQQTVWDVGQRLLSRMGGNPAGAAAEDINRAIADAYRELPNLHDWTYYIGPWRFFLNASYSTGGIEYDQTGGAYGQMVTLTGGVWPTWAARGYIRLGSVVAYVKDRISDTILTLDPNHNFGVDILPGAPFELIQDSYPLPPDFVAGYRGLPQDNWGEMTYMRPTDWLAMQRHVQVGSGQPFYYTFTKDDKNAGRMCMRLFPPPDIAKTLDFLYRRSPRPIQIWDRKLGRATVVAGSNQVTLSNGGRFNNGEEGTVLRLSDDATNLPTSAEGLNPYAVERIVTQVLTSTTALLDDVIPDSYNAVLYRLSDPIDIEPTSMFNVFHAGCVRHLARFRDRKEQQDAASDWKFQLDLAKEADMRDSSVDQASLSYSYRQRLANMPLGPMV